MAEPFPTYAELTQTHAWAGGAPVPIAMPPDDDPADSASTTSRYTERAVLGVGGMGKIVLARDARIGREVAVKQLRADRDLHPEERARFLREAQVQGQLEHPSIVPVYDIDRRPDGAIFFTMRRVVGRTLHAILEDHRLGSPDAARHTPRELLQAFATVCLAVDYAHSRGVIHRDLKPANIMLGDFGEVYVLDWGLARLLETDGPASVDPDEPPERLSVPGIPLGTPLYMAPEQSHDPNVDATADVFALGAVLFEILTLERLRTARDVSEPVDARPSVRTPDRQVALELEILCVRATQADPRDRYPTARAMHDALARFLEGDRELEQRRELAAGHAARARAALRRAADPTGAADPERETGIALRETARALALEPGNPEHVATFAELIAAPPRTVPSEVRTRIDDQHQEVIRSGTHFAIYAGAAWFVFLPVLLGLGLRRADYLVLIALAVITAATLAFIATRQHHIGRPIQCVALVAIMLAAVGTSRILGPLILMPTILASWVIVLQTNPDRFMRIFGMAAGLIGILGPIALELLGVWPSSYRFVDGNLVTVPQMTELPHLATLGFMSLANTLAGLIPALFVARLRTELSRAEERELLQAHQLRRLPAELLRASGRDV